VQRQDHGLEQRHCRLRRWRLIWFHRDIDGPVPHSFFLNVPRAHVQMLVTCEESLDIQNVIDSIRLVADPDRSLAVRVSAR
jgi:hypothetical protein